MNNKKIKIIFTIFLLIFFIFYISNAVCGAEYLSTFDSASGNTAANRATQNIMGTGIQVIKTVGVGVAIIMLSYIGIKYMIAAPSERADLKKSLAIYVVGAILVLGTTGVLQVVFQFAVNNI